MDSYPTDTTTSQCALGPCFTARDLSCKLKHSALPIGNKSYLQCHRNCHKINLKDMMFFDNEWGNCQTVAKLGVTVVYTPKGVTQQLFNEALEKFPSSEIIGKRRR